MILTVLCILLAAAAFPLYLTISFKLGFLVSDFIEDIVGESGWLAFSGYFVTLFVMLFGIPISTLVVLASG